MSELEAKSGDIMLYRERPECFVVKVLSAEIVGEMLEYEFEILKVLESFSESPTPVGEIFFTSRHKEYGAMAGWHLFDLDDWYAKDWLKRTGVELSEVI